MCTWAKEEKATPCLLTLLTWGEKKDESARMLKKKSAPCNLKTLISVWLICVHHGGKSAPKPGTLIKLVMVARRIG